MIEDPTRYTPVDGDFGICRTAGTWHVTEVVTPQGYWIILEDAYGSEAAARQAAQRFAVKYKERPA